MKRLALLLGAAAVIITAAVVVGYRIAREQPQRFESCHWNGETLVLSYTYGVNERVSPTIDTRGDGPVRVALRIERGDGISIQVGLGGVARFLVYGGPTEVRYEDGPELRCLGATQR